MTDWGASWAAWLREQLDRHATIRLNADLVRASGLKHNGRPVIDDSRVHAWLHGKRPSYDLAVATARALGVPAVEALAAAGYRWADAEDVDERPTYVASRPTGPTLRDATKDQLLAELARRMRDEAGTGA